MTAIESPYKITQPLVEQWDWSEISRRAPFASDPRWDWRASSSNPYLTMWTLIRNSTENWDWRTVTANPAITIRDLQLYTIFPWDKKIMADRIAEEQTEIRTICTSIAYFIALVGAIVRMKFVSGSIPPQFTDVGQALSERVHIRKIDNNIRRLNMFRETPQDNTDWFDMSRDPVMIPHIRKSPNLPWDKYWLSRNPGITLEIVDLVG